jgi:peptidoglycan/LPS O-acetylase OafA/YrhL
LLSNIQVLRAIAAYLVVSAHVLELWHIRHADMETGFSEPIGVFGVDIFFVVSGFIMARTTRGRVIAPSRFLWNRITRVVPLYWAITLTLYGVTLVGIKVFGMSHISVTYLARSLLFMPYVDANGVLNPYPILGVGWTLNFEMFFYLVFSFVLFLNSPNRDLLVVPIFLLTTTAYFNCPNQTLGFFGNTIVWEFVYGVLIARLTECASPARHIVVMRGLVAILAGCVVLGLGPTAYHHGLHPLRFVYSGIPAALILYGAVDLERHSVSIKNRFAIGQGDASYCIYLLHPLVLQVSERLLALNGLSSSKPYLFIAYILTVAVIGLIGTGVHLLVEKPLLRRLRNGAKPAMKVATPAMKVT